MHVTYFDEVKANPQNGQNHYFVGGLSIPMDEIAGVEAQMNELAEEVFGTKELTSRTEFHGAFIYYSKGPFRGKPLQDRAEVLGRLARIIAGNDAIKRVYSAIDTTKLYNPRQAPEFAFAYFCERVEMLRRRTILIGDLDDELANTMIESFARYRMRGTPWGFGIEITKIVDAVHFARSHHSRMIQLADIYLFLETHRWGSRKGPMAKAVSEQIEGVELWAHRYKHWAPGVT